MNHVEILQKAIDKAKENGYNQSNYYCDNFDMFESNGQYCESVIFSQSFAKAFWGTKLSGYPRHKEIAYWQYQLQIMVLESDPITYIAKFL